MTRRLPVADPLIRAAASGKPVDLHGQVVEEPERIQEDLRALFAVSAVTLADTTWQVHGQALVRFSESVPGVHYGDRMHLFATLRRARPQRNPGGFDYRDYLDRRGISVMVTVRRSDQVLELIPGGGSRLWSRLVLPIRRAVRSAVDRNLSGGPAGLLKGVLLGEKRAVPDPVREAFTRAGVNHVLAVSGLHVGLVGACVLFCLRLFSFGRRTTCVLTAAVLVLYALVTGMPPSVLRACASGCIGLFAAVGSRDGDGLNTLGLAGLGLVTVRPQMLWDVGFQLSFAATGSILLFHEPVRGMLGGQGRGIWGRWVAPPWPCRSRPRWGPCRWSRPISAGWPPCRWPRTLWWSR